MRHEPQPLRGRPPSVAPAPPYWCAGAHPVPLFSLSNCLLKSIPETEVETKWRGVQRRRRSSRFLKGPITLELLHRAAQLPGKALAVYLAVRHRADLQCSLTATLPAVYLAEWGVDRYTRRRAIAVLEDAGLIRIADRRPGRSTVVALVDPPKTAIEAERLSQQRNDRKNTTK